MDVGSKLLNAEVGVVWTCGPVKAVRGDCEPTGTNVDGGWHCEFATGLEVAVMVVGGDCEPTGMNVDGFTVDDGWHCKFATAEFGVRIFIPSVLEVDG